MDTEKDMYCLNMHVNVIFPAAVRGEKPNLAQPCYNCKYGGKCDYEWHTYIDNAFKRFGLSYYFPMGSDKKTCK